MGVKGGPGSKQPGGGWPIRGPISFWCGGRWNLPDKKPGGRWAIKHPRQIFEGGGPRRAGGGGGNVVGALFLGGGRGRGNIVLARHSNFPQPVGGERRPTCQRKKKNNSKGFPLKTQRELRGGGLICTAITTRAYPPTTKVFSRMGGLRKQFFRAHPRFFLEKLDQHEPGGKLAGGDVTPNPRACRGAP